MSLWLTADELRELTGYSQRGAQKKALGSMGIPFVSRALDGFPMVQRSQFESQRLTERQTKRKEPNLTWLKQA